MSAVGLCLPDAVEGRLAKELERHGFQVAAREKSGNDMLRTLPSSSVEILLVGAGVQFLTAPLLAACDSLGIRLIALAGSDLERRNTAQLGLREVLPSDAEWSDIEAALTAGPAFGTTSNAGDPEARVRGRVVTVWGPSGSPGRTTVAIGIAAELATRGFSVALADADTHSASVAPAIGLLDEAPGFAAACRLAGADALSLTELERVGQRYSSPHGSFWVLTGIGRPSRWPEISGERVVAVLAQCRDWVDFTVVDTGFSLENDEEISSDLFAPRRNAATISALREADQVVAVGSADPVGLSRFLRAHVDLIEVVDAERIIVAMNKIRASAIGLNPSAQVEQTLRRFGGIAGATLIPHDQGALDAAVLSGKTVRDVAGKSPARAALRRLVTTSIVGDRAPSGQQADQAARRGRLRRRR